MMGTLVQIATSTLGHIQKKLVVLQALKQKPSVIIVKENVSHCENLERTNVLGNRSPGTDTDPNTTHLPSEAIPTGRQV